MPPIKTKYKAKASKPTIIEKLTKIFNIAEITFLILITISFYLNQEIKSPKIIYIPNGGTGEIITHLKEKGFDLNSLDSITLRLLGYIQSGWIDIGQTSSTKADFLYKLTTSKAAMYTVTLVPGETSYFFLKQLAIDLELSEEKLFYYYKMYTKYEDGNILAESYKLPIGMNEEATIKYLLSYTDKKYQDFSNKVFGEYNEKKWYNYITAASVIQKEAANVREMPIVASVVYNRLGKNMRLQMDGTLNYGQFSHTKVTPAMIDTDTSSYNTYKFNGLPKGPICAVSFDAIKSAIFPAQTPYLYFFKSKTNNAHSFSSDYNTHVNIIHSKAPDVTKSIESFPVKKIDIKSIWSH